MPSVLQSGIEIIGKLAAGLIQAIPKLIAQIPTIITNIKNEFLSVDWGKIGLNIIKGIANGLANAAGALWDAVKSALGDFKDNILGFFGMANKENSVRGWKGVLKKLGYWLMIMVAFGASAIFIEIGKAIGVDLGITTLLGWFVLASLLINEIRSILENFVEAGFNVPIILIKGLEVADKVVNKDGDSEGE